MNVRRVWKRTGNPSVFFIKKETMYYKFAMFCNIYIKCGKNVRHNPKYFWRFIKSKKDTRNIPNNWSPQRVRFMRMALVFVTHLASF